MNSYKYYEEVKSLFSYVIGNDHIANQIILSCVSSARKFNQTTKNSQGVFSTLEKGMPIAIYKKRNEIIV